MTHIPRKYVSNMRKSKGNDNIKYCKKKPPKKIIQKYVKDNR